MYAQVIIDITNEALNHAYTYRVPEGMQVKAGDRVSIPFGHLRKTGYVLELTEKTGYAPEKLRELFGKVEGAVTMQEQLIRLAVWMSEEYGATLNQCLKTVLPVKRAIGKNRRRIDPLMRYLSEEDREVCLNAEQQRAVEEVLRGFRRSLSADAAVFSEKNAASSESNAGSSDGNAVSSGEGVLSPEHGAVRYLLHGVTGSGKTEVYLHIMDEVLRAGRQIIFLIPEISLTYQTVLRVSRRFRGRVAVLHSRMSMGERFEQYRRCERGEVDILIGPRSAVFAPFARLGLLVMDEEHEAAYKSETAPRYETREVAWERARIAGCPLVYGSATPSLRLFHLAKEGEVRLLTLSRRAKAGSRLPVLEIADLREELKRGNRSIFSERLSSLLSETLRRGEQSMLFLNRRGYSSFISCRSCGEAVKCPHCDVSLTLHRDGILRCHYCGYAKRLMQKCPSCGSPYIAPFGFGTEKLESFTRERFPEARILRMDADTTRRKGGHEAILSAFRKQEADILIGTQMIVKGHDFPNVTLVGMIAADMSLSAPDFTAQERTFQLLTQAAGRAGRGETPGNVVIQTYQPEHYAIQLSQKQDYRGFYEREMQFRRQLGYPPCEYLLTIQLSAGDEDLLNAIAQETVRELLPYAAESEAELLGPFNATVYKLKDIFRKIVYIKHREHAIIIKLREGFAARLRKHDRRGQLLLNYDIQ